MIMIGPWIVRKKINAQGRQKIEMPAVLIIDDAMASSLWPEQARRDTGQTVTSGYAHKRPEDSSSRLLLR